MTAFMSRVAHSLILRLALILFVLGGLIAAVLLVSWLVFQTIETQMAALKTQRMPELRGSAGVVAATDATRALLTSSLVAETPAALKARGTSAEQLFNDFDSALGQLPEDEIGVVQPKLKTAERAVSQLLEARSREFAQRDAMMEAIQTASQNASAASTLIEEANDTAFFDMTLSGEETITVIDDTLTRLLEEDFEQFQNALSMRGEINLIAGLAIAYSQNQESQISSIIADLAKSATDRLSSSLEQVRDKPAFEEVLPVLSNAIATFNRVFAGKGATVESSEVLAARLSVDTVLSPTLDDIYFNLVIANDEAKKKNESSLTHLLQKDVERMRVNARLDAAAKHFFALLLQVSAAQSPAELELRQRSLAAQAEDVVRLKAGTEFETQENLTTLLQFADPQTGLGALRLASFDAQATALAAAQEATTAVDAIAYETSRFSESALSKIEEAAEFLGSTVEDARTRLMQIANIALGIVLVVPILLWYYVTRPIGRVTLVTERLASGDLSEIHGLPSNQGELGRMSSALHVFRKSALTTIELQKEERRREREALAAEQIAERTRREDERRAAEEAAKRQEAEHEKEAKLAAEAERRQQKEIAERTARMEEQAHIVSTLAKGLNSLAAGDLTFEIDGKFPEAYDSLRLDFNAAIKKLSKIVEQLKGSSETIENSCSEIAAASDDLARRTESNASTLAETVSSVGSLSSSVADAASNADDAASTIQSIREKAKLNKDVVVKAKSAMGRVEEASGKITSIVDIIDSVAFQTNLLALNAGVEAARAGSAGQGFAVVANEVRTLAQRCSEAASEIGSVVQESNMTVQEGVDLTVQANEAMEAINDGIDQISEIVGGIARSSGDQASGLENVNLAIQDLDRSTQQNAAMFEQTSASNQLLSSEAATLSSVVKSFTLQNAQSKPHADPKTYRTA